MLESHVTKYTRGFIICTSTFQMSHWHVIFDVEMTVFFIFFYFVLLYFSTEDNVQGVFRYVGETKTTVVDMNQLSLQQIKHRQTGSRVHYWQIWPDSGCKPIPDWGQSHAISGSIFTQFNHVLLQNQLSSRASLHIQSVYEDAQAMVFLNNSDFSVIASSDRIK